MRWTGNGNGMVNGMAKETGHEPGNATRRHTQRTHHDTYHAHAMNRTMTRPMTRHNAGHDTGHHTGHDIGHGTGHHTRSGAGTATPNGAGQRTRARTANTYHAVTALLTALVAVGFPAAGGATTASPANQSTAPSFSVNPSSLAFGNETVGVQSAAKSVTITNTGHSTLAITGSRLTSAQFAASLNGCTAVAAGRTCSVSVTFKPTAEGAAAATLTFLGNAAQSPTVALSGTGIAPVLSVSPSSLSFTCQNASTQCAEQRVTVSNTGNGPLTLTSIVLAGHGYRETSNSCGASLAAGQRCQVGLAYQALSSGVVTGTLTVTTNAGTKVVALSANCRAHASP